MSKFGVNRRQTAGLGLALLGAGAMLVQPLSVEAQRRRNSKASAEIGALKADLGGASRKLAVAAAKSLGTIKDPQANEALLNALAMGLHPEVAAAALEAVTLKASPDSFEVLAFYLHHRNSKVRATAIKAMGSLKDKRGQSLILAALGDANKTVRAAAAGHLAATKNKKAIEPLMALLKRGDEAAADGLAALANADLARAVGELIGNAPDGLLARCLGSILMRPDFGPEEARIEVVKSLGKIGGNDALEQLTNYVGSLPEKPPRKSRKHAEAIIEAQLGAL